MACPGLKLSPSTTSSPSPGDNDLWATAARIVVEQLERLARVDPEGRAHEPPIDWGPFDARVRAATTPLVLPALLDHLELDVDGFEARVLIVATVHALGPAQRLGSLLRQIHGFSSPLTVRDVLDLEAPSDVVERARCIGVFRPRAILPRSGLIEVDYGHGDGPATPIDMLEARVTITHLMADIVAGVMPIGALDVVGAPHPEFDA